MQIPYRLHEWLADRVRWVQYPRVRQIHRPKTQPLAFKFKMHPLERIVMVLWGVAITGIALAALGLALCAAYVFIKVLFT